MRSFGMISYLFLAAYALQLPFPVTDFSLWDAPASFKARNFPDAGVQFAITALPTASIGD